MPDLTDTAEKPHRRPPFGAPYVLTLAVIGGVDCQPIFRINAPYITVGRGEEASFTLEDDQISKEHFAIDVSGTVYTIFDLGSTNGTQVNDKDLSPGKRQRLKHTDEIQVGDTRILFSVTRFKAPR